MSKYIRSLIVVVVALLPVNAAAYAANPIPIFVDGEELQMDVMPRLINDRTMVPVRAVTEAVGCTVEWHSEDQRVVINSPVGGDPLIVMEVGNPVVTVNSYNGDTGAIGGRRVAIDSPPVIISGRTLVPLRFIAETIGFTVEWDNGAVYLYSALYEIEGRGDYFGSDPGDGGIIPWEGTYENAGYYLEITDDDGRYFNYVITLSSANGRTVVSEGMGEVDATGLFAMSGEIGFSLYEDYGAIDVFAPESSEWANMRGQYVRY
jgi:hypothetical protein